MNADKWNKSVFVGVYLWLLFLAVRQAGPAWGSIFM
jgi:hypothetical protein